MIGLKLLKNISAALLNKVFELDGQLVVDAINMINRIRWRMPIHLEYSLINNFYVVSDISVAGDFLNSLAFSRKERLWVYAKGVAFRINHLGAIYGFGLCNIKPSDQVIDCGANVGELSAFLHNAYGCSIIAIEPELDEARCIARNTDGAAKVLNLALWSESKDILLYSKNRTADSSIFETENYDAITTVKAMSLDDIFNRYHIDRLKLLKLEAEGAEPEILSGATHSLAHIEYISADLGPERGLEREATVVPVCNHLFKSGFELVHVYPNRQIFLFKNKSISGGD